MEYSKYTKIKLLLTPNEISRIKTNIIGKYKTITISESLKKINDDNIPLEILENDIISKVLSIDKKKQIIIH